MTLIVSFDAAWSGLGWAICTEREPLFSGHLAPGTHRMRDLRWFLTHDLEDMVQDCRGLLGPDDPGPRVVFERPNPNQGKWEKGNPRVIGWSLGNCAGPLELWGCRRSWEYPWARIVNHWRKPWGLRGNKASVKRGAVNLVRMYSWGGHLGMHKPINKKGDGPQGDVAEAILIGVGAARDIRRDPKCAPRGPATWEPRVRCKGAIPV